MAGNDTGRDASKVEAIQLLRAVAAATVALSHLTFAFADHIGPGLELGGPDRRSAAGQIAVALFFIVSGYVMVVAAGPLFGQPDAVKTFWMRRLVRILPSYWFASLLLALVFLAIGFKVEPREFAQSLFLIPLTSDAFVGRPIFFLWPGWTLFYEMTFYLLFGIGIAAGRRFTVAFVVAALSGLVITGLLLAGSPAWLVSMTRPVLLLFPVGMALAVVRARGVALPASLRVLAAVLGGFAWRIIPAPSAPAMLGFDYLLWAGVPAVLMAVALSGGPLRLPFFPVIDRLGNASYALYLLHVPLAHAWINLFPLRLGAWPFLISLALLVYGASLFAHVYLERPALHWLNRRLSRWGRPNAKKP